MSIKNQPEFEAETDTTEEVAMSATTKDNTDAATKAATKAATAIAKAATGAVAVAKPRAKYAPSFSDKLNAISIEEVENWKMAAPAITAEQGACKHSKLGTLGLTITLRVESWNYRYMVVPGSKDKEAKDKCRDSYDKVTLSGEGTTVEAYLAALNADGYAMAHVEPYVDLWGYIEHSAKFGDVSDDDEELVRVQLAKTSSSKFGYFCGQRGRKESEGKVAKLESILITAVPQEGKNGSYTNFDFSVPKVP